MRHVKFGEGTVLEIRSGGRDYEVTVDFDSAGVRKMFAKFAKLVKDFIGLWTVSRSEKMIMM